MKIPTIAGIIDRRILVNYRIDPELLGSLLPAPFKPKIVNEYAIGGICLIRLKNVRPKLSPFGFGLSSENAAHRFAVQWSTNGQTNEGVYVPRRDTNSYLNTLAGGRIFPGVHHFANFKVEETNQQYSIAMQSSDNSAAISVEATLDESFPDQSIFSSLQSASDFFEAGSLGYSDSHTPNCYDGLELNCNNWKVHSLNVSSVSSSYFDDQSIFPLGSIKFDCALLMENIAHRWSSRESLMVEEKVESM